MNTSQRLETCANCAAAGITCKKRPGWFENILARVPTGYERVMVIPSLQELAPGLGITDVPALEPIEKCPVRLNTQTLGEYLTANATGSYPKVLAIENEKVTLIPNPGPRSSFDGEPQGLSGGEF